MKTFHIDLKDMDPRKVVLFYDNLSGSNSVALFKRIPEEYKKKFDVRLYKASDAFKEEIISDAIYSSIIVTNFMPNLKYHKFQVLIQTWHGIPMKTLGLMDNHDMKNEVYISDMQNNVDISLSYSQFYTTLFNACFGLSVDRYVITGAPRCDFLFDSKESSLRLLEKLFPEIEIKALKRRVLIIYAPTYRYIGERSDGVPTTEEGGMLTRGNLTALEEILEKNQMIMFVKLHPFEEEIFKHAVEDSVRDIHNLYLIENSTLEKEFIDFYELLPAFDLLITDYSSIYYDWVLTEKPTIFYLYDREIYRKFRNFLYTPEYFMIGPVAKNIEELAEMLSEYQKLKSESIDRIKKLKDLFHKFSDNRSSQRVWDLIEKISDDIESFLNRL